MWQQGLVCSGRYIPSLCLLILQLNMLGGLSIPWLR